MAYLTPDKTTSLNGVLVKEYFLTKHNVNGIAMPSAELPVKPLGITIHNTQSITTGAGTTMAEQYTRATANGNMGDVRVHFYVDDVEAWQNLPLSLSGWHAADGSGNGNRKTIAIECIMNGQTGTRNEKAEDNCAKLTAYLLDKYGLTTADVYSHSHWYSGKTCPLYILPHWNSFIDKIERYTEKRNSDATPMQKLYRVRKEWSDVSSQIGAYSNLESAKGICSDGYFVFDETGTVVYPIPTTNELPVIKIGSKGSKVKALQALLIGYGYDLSPYGADSDFGNKTQEQLVKFQNDNGLTADGICGKETWSKLLGG